MTAKDWLEIAGYIGSALVLVSFLMTSVVKLRIINMAGSVISCVYALLIGSYPLALMNGALMLINLYFLWKILRAKKDYVLVETQPADPVFTHFLDEYREDIEKCFPGIDLTQKADYACLTLCDDAPAGLLLGRAADGQCDLVLDYSLPKYRDFSLGRFLKEQLPARGITELRYAGPAENHMKYLEKMGFTKQADGAYLCRL